MNSGIVNGEGANLSAGTGQGSTTFSVGYSIPNHKRFQRLRQDIPSSPFDGSLLEEG